jgi:hypothetical protein
VNENRGYRSQSDGTEYLFWVTKIDEARIPKFDEPGMVEKVEARWRQVQARPLVLEKVETLAQVAKQAEGSLIEYFSSHPNPDVKTVVGTEFFSWLEIFYPREFMYMGRPPTFFPSEVRETGVMPDESIRNNKVLKNIRNDFMQAVYNLEPGGIAVTHNESKDTFYVVRLAEVAPSDDMAFDSYSTAVPGLRSIYRQTAVQDRLDKARQGALKKVFEKTKFQWKIKPSEYQQQERLNAQQRPARQRPTDQRLPGEGPIPLNLPQF